MKVKGSYNINIDINEELLSYVVECDKILSKDV